MKRTMAEDIKLLSLNLNIEKADRLEDRVRLQEQISKEKELRQLQDESLDKIDERITNLQLAVYKIAEFLCNTDGELKLKEIKELVNVE